MFRIRRAIPIRPRGRTEPSWGQQQDTVLLSWGWMMVGATATATATLQQRESSWSPDENSTTTNSTHYHHDSCVVAMCEAKHQHDDTNFRGTTTMTAHPAASTTKQNAPQDATKFHVKQNYEIMQVMGQGGYGLVYKARRKSDGRTVALKTMPRECTGQTDFEREVAALQILSQNEPHEHIVQFYDLHRDDKNYYLAMELIEGGELFDHLITNGPYSEGKAASFLRQFAEALHFVHSSGLTHADLKPENLMLSANHATLKLVDFGCAGRHDLSRTNLQLPADVFAQGCSFLHMVALGNQFELEGMLQSNPDLVNFRDYDFRTPLHLAASEGHVDICRFLVAKGARVNRCDRWGGAPLDDAHRHGHTQVVEYLRRQGAKFGNTTSAVTKFIEAASAGDLEQVQAMLEFGNNIDLNQGDYDRRTALHLAAGEGRLEVVELLCDSGANVNVEDRWGNRPLDDARKARKHSSKIVQVLKSYGAKPSGVSALFDFGGGKSQTTKPTKQQRQTQDPEGPGSSPGTVAYWPPEKFAKGAAVTPATDMWATGVIMYILLTGTHPIDKFADMSDGEVEKVLVSMGCDQDDHLQLMEEIIFDERIEGLSASCIALLRQLMHPDPKKRMTTVNFLRHPWVQGLTASWETLEGTHRELKTLLQKRFRTKILKKFGATPGEVLDKDKLRLIFNAIDLEGNGVLDPNELRVALRSVREAEDSISKIIASLDLHRAEGKVKGVSWEAFQSLMHMNDEEEE